MTKPMNILHVVTEYGDVEVREHELASITDGQLYNLGMSRDCLHRVFAEGVRLMEKQRRTFQDPEEAMDGVWPLACETQSGKWKVGLCLYSTHDPLLRRVS
jgi:hypothetical protein